MTDQHEVATLEAQNLEVGTHAAMARERHELQASFTMAHQFPREVEKAWNMALTICGQAAFARDAIYSYPRGGSTIEGPSVQLARELARYWGNIRYGVRVVAMDTDWIHLQGYCMDLEANTQITLEDKFKNLIFRKKKGWIRPDERDLRELLNRRGAILERNCVLKTLPHMWVEQAMERIKATLNAASKGDLATSPDMVIEQLLAGFSTLGVTPEMLERKLGHPLAELGPKELTGLRGIYASLRDGQTERADHFEFSEVREEGKGLGGLEGVMEREGNE